MKRSSVRLAQLALVISLAVGCQDKDKATAPGTTSASATVATTTASGTAMATGMAAPAAPDTKTTAESASVAAAFPATALPAKQLADFTIGLPIGGKLDKTGDDKASLETPDYKLMLKKAPAKDEMAGMRDMVKKMPGFKAITVDKPDGMVVETAEKGAKQFLVTRYVKAGDVNLSCENALTKPPKDEAKAREAWDVCGTLKKK